MLGAQSKSESPYEKFVHPMDIFSELIERTHTHCVVMLRYDCMWMATIMRTVDFSHYLAVCRGGPVREMTKYLDEDRGTFHLMK